jgi:tetratricopeptide (TPR) repeat protein
MTLSVSACKKAADSVLAYNRGVESQERQDHDKAIVEFTEAIRLNPTYVEAYSYRARSWRAKGASDKALADYTEVIRLNPKDAMAYFDRGVIWDIKGELENSIADFSEAIRLGVKSPGIYAIRADSWNRKKQFDNAIADCGENIRLQPSDSFAYYVRGIAWHGKRNHGKGFADFQEALRLNPKDDLSMGWMAWILATSPDDQIRDGKRAVELARKAMAFRKGNVLFIEALAAGHAECGDFEEAVRWQERSFEIPRTGDNAHGRLRLELYRKKQPYRDP